MLSHGAVYLVMVLSRGGGGEFSLKVTVLSRGSAFSLVAMLSRGAVYLVLLLQSWWWRILSQGDSVIPWF